MRRPQPFWKKSHAAFYCTIKGKQYRLGTTQEEAYEKFYELMAKQGDLPSKRDMRVSQLIDSFLAWCELDRAEETYKFYQDPLESFKEFVGNLKVSNITIGHVERWLRRKGKISHNYRYNLIRAVKRPFAWGIEKGHLTTNPLQRLKVGSVVCRQTYLEPEEWNLLMQAVKAGPFREFLILLRATGARPLEVRSVEKRHFDSRNELWRFLAEESKGGENERIVHLNDASGVALALTKKYAAIYPTGPLFRNTQGQPWTKASLKDAFRRLPKFDFKVSCYTIRHTYCTDSITAGVDLQSIASQMGHVDLRMLSKTYAHLQLKRQHLKDMQAKGTAGVVLDITPVADASISTVG